MGSQSTNPIVKIDIQIKVLDLRTFSLSVDKCIPVPALKEIIANESDIPPERQRLIYRGRVLKDDQLLSHYNVENGDTLHLVPQHPSPHPLPTANSDPGMLRGASRDPTVMGGNNEQISTASPREIPSHTSGASRPYNPSSSTEVPASLAPLQRPGPLVIPDSVATLSRYLNQVAYEFGHNIIGEGSHNPHPYYISIPSFRFAFPTAEFLAQVLGSTRQLLINQAAESLRVLETQLQNQQNVTDASARFRIQANAQISGYTFQNLGALLLELGRTTRLLRMGDTPAGALVIAGPAVYVNESSPNHIMAEPWELGVGQGGSWLDSRMSIGAILNPQPPVEPMNASSNVRGPVNEQVSAQSGPGLGRPAAQAAQHFAANNSAGILTRDEGILLFNFLRQILPQESQISASGAGPSSAAGENRDETTEHRE